ncbi:MAG: PIN domain-containing protein [Deltaproteobacteria bacterium]|nr:MAG: PIN domain-containing protein [Deltaproteobacteria bacterium]
MIAVDTNILVYAHREDSQFHQNAFYKVKELAEGSQRWAIPWPCIHEFWAIVTHPRIYTPSTPFQKALDQVEAWMESPTLEMIGESEGYWEELKSTLLEAKIMGPAIHDVRVASICKEHHVKALWSADRDFNRIKGIKVINPLISK